MPPHADESAVPADAAAVAGCNVQEGELAESSLRCKARKAASVSVTITGGMLPMAAEVAASRFALAHHESDLVMQASTRSLAACAEQ